MKKNVFLLIITTLFATLIFSACSSDQNQSSRADSEQQQQQTELDRAPDFEVTTIDGEIISLSQSLEEGKPVVVYFTASWCPTCARNWPALSEVYPEFDDKLTLVAISIDPTDTEDVIRKLSVERGFTFPSTAGKPEIMINFGVLGQATTVGVDKEGNIAFKKPGEALTADEFRELFAGLID